MRAKKSLGQHFLKSERALSTIIESAQIKIGDTILEIGPGTGTLTEKLLATSCQLTAVEKDDDLYELLKEKFQKEILSGQLNLIHDDILNFQTSNLQTCRQYSLQHYRYDFEKIPRSRPTAGNDSALSAERSCQKNRREKKAPRLRSG